MSVKNSFLEKIILPASDMVLGYSLSEDLQFLLKSQWWSEDQLAEYQNRKLRWLIKHAYENVPYYNELFKNLKLTPEDIKTKDDLPKIPVLTKEDIRRNFPDRIVARNIPESELVLSSSSGSTGQPLQFYQTKSSLSMWKAAGIRGWYWMGYKLGDKYVKLSQYPRKNLLKKIQDYSNKSLFLSSPHLTDENFKKIVEKINEFKPSVIRGYPEVILFLSNYIKKNNIKIHSPKSVTTTGSILFESTRKLIQEVFNCDVFDAYSSEGNATVSECSTHSCYHSSMEYAINEVLHDGIEAEEGGRGRVITTDLHNYANPFIRYDTQDYVTKSSSKCACGRKLLAFEKIEGRASDILISPTGKLLIVQNFCVYFEMNKAVEHFQIRQNSIDDFLILLKVNSKFKPEMIDEIYKYWIDYIGGSIKLEIKIVDDIPLTQSGKRRFLIRNQEIKLPF